MEVEFYCKDARDVFLSPKSVDLFLVHPPYFAMMDDERYGGDQDLQIHRVKDQEEFSKSTIQYISNMADALKDDGNILLIVPNFYYGILAIADILKGTNLFIDKILVWNFGKLESYGQMQPMFNLILQIRKNKDSKYEIKGLDSLIIDQEWLLSDTSKYAHLGFMNDAFPIEIADILINAFSNEGDTVADLFAGTGTTILSALKNNRKAIYSDASIVQMELAKRRVYDTIEVNNNEKEETMSKDEAINIMLESINADNLSLGVQAGISEKDMKIQIEASQPGLAFMMSNMYDKLKNAGAIA
jgi:DNA modification methylase